MEANLEDMLFGGTGQGRNDFSVQMGNEVVVWNFKEEMIVVLQEIETLHRVVKALSTS